MSALTIIAVISRCARVILIAARRRAGALGVRCVYVVPVCMYRYIPNDLDVYCRVDCDDDDNDDDDAAGGMFRSFEYYKITNYVSFDTPLGRPHTREQHQLPAQLVGPQRSTRAFANKYVCVSACCAVAMSQLMAFCYGA